MIRWILICLILATQPVLAQSPVPSAPSVGANSYILLDFDSGTVIASKDPDLEVEPASITKIMTSYVIFQELDQGNLALDDMVLISEQAWRTSGSRTFVEVGKRVSVEDLLRGVIIQSGNDASVALAEHVAGTEATFAGMMNQTAARLGMNNTQYQNATGLPMDDHYTTAADTARLAQAMIDNFPEYYQWYSEREFTYADIRQQNRNLLLWRDDSVDGLKTGHTQSAGYCLVTSALRDGMRLVSVVMGSSSEQARASESQSLLNYGFRFFETFKLYEPGETLTTERVWMGTEDEVNLGVDRELYVTIPRGRYNELDARVEMERRLTAPIEAGQPIGRVIVALDDEDLDDRDLVALNEVPESGFFGRTADRFRMWAGGLFGGDD